MLDPIVTTRLLLTPRQAAAAMVISPRSLSRITHDGGLPSIKIGRSRRYDPADLADWIDRQKHRATEGEGEGSAVEQTAQQTAEE